MRFGSRCEASVGGKFSFAVVVIATFCFGRLFQSFFSALVVFTFSGGGDVHVREFSVSFCYSLPGVSSSKSFRRPLRSASRDSPHARQG